MIGRLDPAADGAEQRARALSVAFTLERLRGERASRLPMLAGVCDAPGWDMLIQLYLADARGGPLTVEALLSSVGGPASTVRRCLRLLEENGSVERVPEWSDDTVRLSADALDDVQRILAAAF